jgi:hypothetical protein
MHFVWYSVHDIHHTSGIAPKIEKLDGWGEDTAIKTSTNTLMA